MTFGVLALIVFAGLAGPLLGAGGKIFVPVVIGELIAGVVVGRTGLDAVDPSDPTVQFLGEIGFAMLMFSVGAHVPLRERRLRVALPRGALAAGIAVVLAPLGGLAAAWFAGTDDAAVYAVILASGSAAAVLAMLQEARLRGSDALTLTAQVTVADVLTIVAIPIVLQPERAGHAALGALLVAVAIGVIYALAHPLYATPWVYRLRKRSKRRRWALDLRMSLLVLFSLSWLAQESGTSVLIAGFGAGLLVAALRGPKRLFTQVRGLADGFFVPLFFVVLGARLELGALVDHPSSVRLAIALLVLNLVIRAVAAALTRQGLPAALIASAQVGVPAAVVALGFQENVLSPAQGAAIITAALASLLLATLGTSILARRAREAAAREATVAARDQPAPAGARG
jgi:Kef-type K+ transport system membrane component KefB